MRLTFRHGALARVRLTPPSGLATFIALLVVLLPMLGLLQHRWITQLSDAQQAELERGLLTAAVQFGRAFDGEIARATTAARAAGSMVTDDEWRSYADRYTAWRETTEFPDSLRDVLLVDYELGSLRLRRWNQSALKFEETAWPTDLQRWQPPLERALRAGHLVTPLLGGDHSDSFTAFVPVLGRTVIRDQADATPAVLGFNIVRFDLDQIRRRMLPTLTERYFTNTSGQGYRVALTDERDATAVLYTSDRDAALDLTEGVVVDLLKPVRDNAQVVNPKYRLHAQHRPGRVQQAVTELRQRNLAIGLGTLGLLSASIVVFVASSRRAQRLAREQVEVAAGVSHELRTPISVIRLAAQNLSQEIISGDRIRYYGQLIETEADRLGDVVEGALLYASTTSERPSATRVPLAPAAVIDAAVDAAERGVKVGRLDRIIPPDLPQIVGDEAALQCALVNLISNAVKYGGPTGWVGIRAEGTTGRRPEVRITVEDCGPGISEEDLPHIFKPFYRGTSASNHVRGSGLGLALVAQIVAAHKGRVTAVNRPGGGTAFTIALPALRREDRETRLLANANLSRSAQESPQF